MAGRAGPGALAAIHAGRRRFKNPGDASRVLQYLAESKVMVSSLNLQGE